MKRFLSIIITLSILITSSLVGIHADTSKGSEKSVTPSETQTSVSGEKEVSRPEENSEYVNFASAVSKEAKFADDSVIVTMKRGAKEANHVYTAKDFPELDVDYVEDLTYLTNKELLNDPEFMANYTQILQIHLKSPSKENVLSSVGTLSKRSTTDIASAAPNYEMEAIPETVTIDDPKYTNQSYYAERLHLPEAWQAIEDWKNESGNNTTTIKVAVIDTGVMHHDDLNVSTGFDFDNNNTITNDSEDTHGLNVAGVIGAIANNGIGIVGTCWNVEIVPIQFDILNDSQFVSIMTYLNNHNIPMANISYGLSTENLTSARVSINNYFGLLVMSAGNQGRSTTDLPRVSSLDCNNIITVMGTIRTSNSANEGVEVEAKHERSNYSKTAVDIASPMSAFTTSYDTSTSEYTYITNSGTSFSAPYVTGIAAMIKSLCPKLCTTEIKSIIMSSYDSYDCLANFCVTGGFINAEKAINHALSYTIAEPHTFMKDINFDTYDDLIYLREYNGKRHIQVFLGSNYHYIGTPATYPSTSDITKCSIDTFTTDTFKSTDKVFVEDVNGDHYMDIIVHSTNSAGYRILYVYLGQNGGKFSSAVTTLTEDLYDYSMVPCELLMGKFNNDYYYDFLIHYKNSEGTITNLIYFGTSTGKFITRLESISTEVYSDNQHVFVTNINGEDRNEIVIHRILNGCRQFLIYRFNSDGSIMVPVTVSTTDYHPGESNCKYLTGDFNGDGCGDFYVWCNDGDGNGNHILYLGQPNNRYSVNGISIDTSLDYHENQQLFVGDVNSDYIDDVIMHWIDPSTDKVKLRVCYGGTSNALSVSNTVDTTTSIVINDENTVYRVHVGDVNGAGTDVITEVANPATAYRSTALINVSTSNGFQVYPHTHILRTYFYIDY